MCIYYHKYLQWTGKENVVNPCLVSRANIEIYFGNHRVLFAKSLVVVCEIFVGVPPWGKREDESKFLHLIFSNVTIEILGFRNLQSRKPKVVKKT